MLNLEFPLILDLFKEHIDNERSNSAAFLIWYLENYYRLSTAEAIDSVCDQKGDKGIDGIYINHMDETIDVFQTKLTEKTGRTLGDTYLKQFVGTLEQLQTADSIDAILHDSQTNKQLMGLIDRIDLKKFIKQYQVRGIFISNMEMDSNGSQYVQHTKNIIVRGPAELQRTFISNKRNTPTNQEFRFTIGESEYLKYSANGNVFAIIAPISAKELINISGIENQEIFSYNVRGHLGNTSVNKDIVQTLKNPELHKKFPLFHNGITAVCEEIRVEDNSIWVKDLFVVNGCQSLSSFHKNKNSLSESLKVLVKFVQVSVTSELAQDITNYSNNQNGVKARDFKSNNSIQIRLKKDIEENFPDYYFEIKRGETCDKKDHIISNEEAGIWMMSFDLKEPWSTHRRYQIFDEKYNEIFSGPQVDSYRIIALFWFDQIIREEIVLGLNNKLMAKYSLTRSLVMYLLREILEADPADKGLELIKHPEHFVSNLKNLENLKKAISTVVKDILIDLDAEVKDLGDDFDYKSKLRDHKWIKDELCKNIVTSYKKQLARKRVNSFSEEWICLTQKQT